MWGGVHKASNVRKCRFKHIQLYRLEKVGLKALLDSSQPDVLQAASVFQGHEKVGFKNTLLRRLEKVDLKALGFRRDGRSRNPKFGSLPKPLQKRTVWMSFFFWRIVARDQCVRMSFWALVCVLWGGVRKGSSVWKCRLKHIQLHRIENVG